MSADERYDIVIVGGGPNGTTAAAYLAKCGLSVCVLEERYEAGGSCETPCSCTHRQPRDSSSWSCGSTVSACRGARLIL